VLAPGRDQELLNVAGAARGVAAGGKQAGLGVGVGPEAEPGEEVPPGEQRPVAERDRVRRLVELDPVKADRLVGKAPGFVMQVDSD
jgi:hypothetical protein